MLLPGIVGAVVTVALAQLIDGRVAFFVGAGSALALGSWRAGQRAAGEYLGIAVATAAGVAVFFVLIGLDFFRSSALLGWVALLLGLATAWTGSTWWSRRRFKEPARALADFCMPFYRETVRDTVPYIVPLPSGTEWTVSDTSEIGEKSAEMILTRLVELDRTAVDIDPVLFANEIAALRLEVFAIAWYHRYGDDKRVLGQARLLYDYLLNRNARRDIWEALRDYNKSAAKSTEKSLPESDRSRSAQIVFRNTFKWEIAKKWDKAGIPPEVAGHALNLFFTESSWTSSNQWTPIFLAYAFTRRIGKTTPEGSPTINDEARAHILGTIHGMYRDVNEHLNALDIKA